MSFVLLIGESPHLSAASATSGYSESSTLIECSTTPLSFMTDRDCSASNINVLTANQPAVNSTSAKTNLANHAGAIKDSINVIASCAMSLSSQVYDTASPRVPLPDTNQHEMKTAIDSCSSVSFSSHSASCNHNAVSDQSSHCSSHALLSNQKVPFKVIFRHLFSSMLLDLTLKMSRTQQPDNMQPMQQPLIDAEN